MKFHGLIEFVNTGHFCGVNFNGAILICHITQIDIFIYIFQKKSDINIIHMWQ